MSIINQLYDSVRDAWASVPAPPAEDLRSMSWEWGEEAAHAFTGVAPVDVDMTSLGFYAATPLLDLPPRAAAAYLGTYLLSLLKGLEFQRAVGIFDDVRSRAHTLACLTFPDFWESVIRPYLPPKCRDALAQVVTFLAAERETLALSQEDTNTMVEMAAKHGSDGPND